MSRATLEYVASGFWSYKGLQTKAIRSSQKHIEQLAKVLAPLNEDHHKFSILFNGYAEKPFGGPIFDFKKLGDHVHKIHVDSGGLQMITRNGTSTAALRNDVYHVQSQFGCIGMCFDELPVITKTEKALMSDYRSRMIDVDNFDDYAIRTAQNIKDQINVFRETGTVCKLYVIAQGNSAEKYERWMKTIIDNLDEEDLNFISGIAYSPTSCGMGQREVIEQIYAMSKIDIPDHIKKNVHLLGMGSYRRFIPYALLINSGYFDGYHFSYDSTSHTMKRASANYLNESLSNCMRDRSLLEYNNGRMIEAAEAIGDPDLLADVKRLQGMDIGLYMRTEFKEKYDIQQLPPEYTVWELLELAVCIKEFKEEIDTLVAGDFSRVSPLLMPLKDCKTADDIERYVKTSGHLLESKRVIDSNEYSSLEAFL